jgi:hypothetical protein
MLLRASRVYNVTILSVVRGQHNAELLLSKMHQPVWMHTQSLNIFVSPLALCLSHIFLASLILLFVSLFSLISFFVIPKYSLISFALDSRI